MTYYDLAKLARPYYKDKGQNSWQHIQNVRKAAENITNNVYGRKPTPEEYAAILLHDASVKEYAKDQHDMRGAMIASRVLANMLDKEQLNRVRVAIALHDSNLAKFPSATAELLAAADANPPDLAWLLNKSYTWGKKHNLSDAECYANTLKSAKGHYGTSGSMNYPGIYVKHYSKDTIRNMQKALDTITPEQIQEIVTAYRLRHRLKPKDTSLPISEMITNK